jgi:hypothetical protein
MEDKKTAVFGIYDSVPHAEQTVDRLLAAGFTNDDISVLLPDSASSKDFAHKKNTKAPEGATTGVTTGGVVGGTLGLLAGIGALQFPESVRSLRPAPLWERSPGSESAEQWAA